MLVIITNIPTPYRTAFFDEMTRIFGAKNLKIKVLYCAKTEPNRHWPFEPELMQHDFEILKGFHPSIKNVYPHINPSIISKLRSLSPKFIICAGSWNTPTVMIAVLKRINDTPIYFWSEGHEDAVINSKGPIAKVRSFILNKFDGFLVPNTKSEAWINNQLLTDKPLVNLPNTVNEDFFINARQLDKKAERVKHNVPQNHCVFLQVAQLEEKKGPVQLATSFLAECDKQLSNCTLIFVGTGTLLNKLNDIAQQSNDKIRVIGQQNMEQVRQWLVLSDWFVLNTNKDPNPLTPIEASFTGTPCILSTKAGNFNEICKQSNGIAIDNTESPLSALISAKHTSSQRYKELSINAFNNAKWHFSRDVVIGNLYSELFTE
jgi:glycosyltransferase involved in cell wall biosynthesis